MIWQPGLPVELTTDRYLLRSLQAGDATARYQSWLSDPEVNRFMRVRLKEQTLSDLVEYIDSHDNRSSFLLGVFSKDDGTHVGNLRARCDLYHKTAELGVMIGDLSHWGRGTVIESRAALLNFLFDDVGVVKAFGGPYSNNLSAIFNYKAQGFEVEGILKSQFLSEKKRVDWIIFGMHRNRWVGLRG